MLPYLEQPLRNNYAHRHLLWPSRVQSNMCDLLFCALENTFAPHVLLYYIRTAYIQTYNHHRMQQLQADEPSKLHNRP